MKIDRQELKERLILFSGVMLLTMGLVKIISYL